MRVKHSYLVVEVDERPEVCSLGITVVFLQIEAESVVPVSSRLLSQEHGVVEPDVATTRQSLDIVNNHLKSQSAKATCLSNKYTIRMHVESVRLNSCLIQHC